MASECEVATCGAAGMCEVANAEAGAACGDPADAGCDGADTCDGSGTCVDNVLADGMDCTECAGGVCLCNAGACDACVVFAETNLFTTERALVGWQMTGGWGLYNETPPGQNGLPVIPFGNRVLGTDGNRQAPYPGGHAERSFARTPPTELATSLSFQSWHIDEGSGSFDNKSVRVSTDGGTTWTDILSCQLDPGLPFCTQVNTREPDAWDTISVNLPAPLIGQVGIIEFTYDTGDSCCDFERGWYIDVTNFATECACTTNAVCEPYGGDCGNAVCGSNSACNVNPVPVDTVCGDATGDTCTTPDSCDGFGICRPNNNTNGLMCTECPAGEDCTVCSSGQCNDCIDLPDPNTFDNPPSPTVQALGGWTFNTVSGGGWAIFNSIPSNEQNEGALTPLDAPMLGIDGSTAPPFDGVSEVATADVTTRPDIVPDAVTFQSWHQDQGGPSLDIKRIELSIDSGMTWNTLADCAAGGVLAAFPFCSNTDNRDPEDWDNISLNTSRWAGMLGLLRFSYDTVTACCGFERGWYIDELNFAQTCQTPDFSVGALLCELQTEPFCLTDLFCGWDPGAAACVQCSNFGGEKECVAQEGCEFDVNVGSCIGTLPMPS